MEHIFTNPTPRVALKMPVITGFLSGFFLRGGVGGVTLATLFPLAVGSVNYCSDPDGEHFSMVVNIKL